MTTEIIVESQAMCSCMGRAWAGKEPRMEESDASQTGVESSLLLYRY